MARRTLAVETPPAPPPARVVTPDTVYLADEFRRLFGLRASSVRREVREGRLRVAKRCGRYYLLGEWVLQWLRAGEVTRKDTAGQVAP